jgi:hypothetical protein
MGMPGPGLRDQLPGAGARAAARPNRPISACRSAGLRPCQAIAACAHAATRASASPSGDPVGPGGDGSRPSGVTAIAMRRPNSDVASCSSWPARARRRRSQPGRSRPGRPAPRPAGPSRCRAAPTRRPPARSRPRRPPAGEPPTTGAGCASPRTTCTVPGGAAAGGARRRASGSPVPARSPTPAAARSCRRGRRSSRTPGPRARHPHRRTAARQGSFPVTAPRSRTAARAARGQFVLHAARPAAAPQPEPAISRGNDTMSIPGAPPQRPGRYRNARCSRCRRA